MPQIFPSFDALRLTDQIIAEIADRTQGFEGRVGTAWFWRLPGGILADLALDATVTEERWDVIRGRASTTRSGIFSTADFPFTAYATSATSSPYIHDLKGVAEWSNRLYFQMGYLIEDATRWLDVLYAVAVSPRINPAGILPYLSPLEKSIVVHSVEKLQGYFVIKDLYTAFRGQISRARLSRLAREWEARELLTKVPRRVTYALKALAFEDS